MPTVAALRPDRRAYTGAGRVSPIRETPRERAYMPIAPGRLYVNLVTAKRGGGWGLELALRTTIK